MPSPSVGQAAALAADVFSFTDPSDDYLLVPSFSSFSTSKEIEMRIAQVESQREAAQREHEECLKRLSALRVQCEAHGSSLREKQHELHTEMIALEQASNEVASAQSRMAAQLEEAAGLNAQLAHAREETRALKQAHALLLQQQHLAARQMAPAKSELAQLEAEIKVLRQQVDEAVLHEKGGEEDGQSPAELQAQVDEARLRRQELQDELHVVNSLRRRQRAATEETRLGEARRELRRLQEENAKASAEVLALRSAPPLQAKPNLPRSGMNQLGSSFVLLIFPLFPLPSSDLLLRSSV